MEIEQRSDDGVRLAAGARPAEEPRMRAVLQHRYGPPSVLVVSEIARPLPGPDDVLVRVGAASVHPGDYFVMTGEPYMVHPLLVTRQLLEMNLDMTCLQTGILHDVVEDTEVTLGDIKTQFGEKIAKLVDGLTKLDKTYETRKARAEKEGA